MQELSSAFYRELRHKNPRAVPDCEAAKALFLSAMANAVCAVLVTVRSEPAASAVLTSTRTPSGDTRYSGECVYVLAKYRGMGLARLVLDELERAAADAGAREMSLTPHSALTDAVGACEALGYRPVEMGPHHSHEVSGEQRFVKRLTLGGEVGLSETFTIH